MKSTYIAIIDHCLLCYVIGRFTITKLKFCQWHKAGRWLSAGTPVSSNNTTDRHDITEILLKVVLNTIALTV
jgi:hypothetical protein